MFQLYEYDESGTVLVADLPRVFKRLGLMKPENHMGALKRAGKVPSDADKVDYVNFVNNIVSEIDIRVNKKNRLSQQIISKMFSLL